MAVGDLTTSPTPWGRDEAADLMVDMRLSSDKIDQYSAHMASGAFELASRTAHAAANLQQSASAVEQIGSAVRLSADRSATAAEEARQNSKAASEGGQVMRDVVGTMEEIDPSSCRIGEIVRMKDTLAFQTNLLALNAAAEAARAGQQGRGFAVVATEVRALATRSATATCEIKALVDSSVGYVQIGSDIVRTADEAIERIFAPHRASTSCSATLPLRPNSRASASPKSDRRSSNSTG